MKMLRWLRYLRSHPLISKEASFSISQTSKFSVFSALLLLATVAGCRGGGKPAATAPPPPEVDTVQATIQRVQDFREFTGRTASANAVEVRARVSGYLLQSPRSTLADSRQAANANAQTGVGLPQVTIHEGDFVTRDTLLFQIDPAPYQLMLEQAEGSLEATRAQLERFKLDLARARELLDTRSISQADYDLAVANVNEASGQIENLKAAVDRAKLDLQYTQVVSPIDGLLGRSLVTNGNLISADSTVLSTVISSNPIYVYFNVDERSLLDYRERIRSGAVKSARDVKIQIRLGLINESGYPHVGYIDFVNNTTDGATGNTQLRGTFENANGALSPGLFARILSPFTAEYEAVMVPTRALGMDQQGRNVMIMRDGKALRQSVELGEIHGDYTVIKQGLKGNETIISSGLQRVRTGMPVKVKSTNSQQQPPNVPVDSNPPPNKSKAGNDQPSKGAGD
jgi:RND family efflux transporter MFP subunit